MTRQAKYPGWRTMTAAQRRNAKYDRIWETYLAQERAKQRATEKAKPFGAIYGDPAKPSFITNDGVPVWMWRKGQRTRFFDAAGNQVGPEHRNVYPAMLSAFAAGWQDPSLSDGFNRACQLEVLSKSRVVHSRDSKTIHNAVKNALNLLKDWTLSDALTRTDGILTR